MVPLVRNQAITRAQNALVSASARTPNVSLGEGQGAAAESDRPAIHFVPQLANGTVGLVGDPNGLLYDPVHKVYHQFFQWSVQHREVWGHVSSTDLVNWRQHPIALQSMNHGVYSGSGAILSDAARTPVLSFAVSTHMSIGLALPANRSDPDLAVWEVLPAPIIETTHCTGPPDKLCVIMTR